MRTPLEAIQLYCDKCKKDDCDKCPFQKFKTGSGIPKMITFQKFCHACMTEQGLMVERCQRYGCPIYPYSVKKSRRRIMKDWKMIMSGKPAHTESVKSNRAVSEEIEAEDVIIEDVQEIVYCQTSICERKVDKKGTP
jgi:hypothetical protein